MMNANLSRRFRYLIAPLTGHGRTADELERIGCPSRRLLGPFHIVSGLGERETATIDALDHRVPGPSIVERLDTE